MFAFAVSQLSGHLTGHLSGRGAAETLVMLLAILTVWSYTSWAATMIRVDRLSTRWMVFTVMFLGFFMNASVNSAFSTSAWVFVIPLLLIQFGRTIWTIQGSTDAEVFRTYIAMILCPTLGKDDIVIMDNLRAHKVAGIRELIEATGAILLYLPPYSPDFNPIEKMWSKIKSILRKMKARSKEEIRMAMTTAFKEITSSDAHGWFESCGYGLIQS